MGALGVNAMSILVTIVLPIIVSKWASGSLERANNGISIYFIFLLVLIRNASGVVSYINSQ